MIQVLAEKILNFRPQEFLGVVAPGILTIALMIPLLSDDVKSEILGLNQPAWFVIPLGLIVAVLVGEVVVSTGKLGTNLLSFVTMVPSKSKSNQIDPSWWDKIREVRMRGESYANYCWNIQEILVKYIQSKYAPKSTRYSSDVQFILGRAIAGFSGDLIRRPARLCFIEGATCTLFIMGFVYALANPVLVTGHPQFGSRFGMVLGLLSAVLWVAGMVQNMQWNAERTAAAYMHLMDHVPDFKAYALGNDDVSGA